MLRATLFMALCIGLSVFLLTGRRDTAAAVGLITFAIAGLAAWFGHARLAQRRPPGFFYLAGLAVLVVTFVQLGLGFEWTPWADLEERYRPREEVAPDGFAGGREVVLVAPTGPFSVKPYSYKRADTSFGSHGVLLRAAWPMSLVYDPLFIPVSDISSCSTSGLDSLRSAMRLRGSPHAVEVLDPEARVIEWCRQHGIGDGRRPEAS